MTTLNDRLDTFTHKQIHETGRDGMGIGGSPVTLGYAENTSGVQALATGNNNIPGLTVTVTVPAGRRIRVTAFVCLSSATAGFNEVNLADSVVGQLQRSYFGDNVANQVMTHAFSAIFTPAAGTHTLTAKSNLPGAGSLYADANEASLLVEDITGSSLPYAASSVPVGMLAYGELAADQSGSTETALSGMSVNISVPAGRTIRIKAQVTLHNSIANNINWIGIKEGSTVLKYSLQHSNQENNQITITDELIVSPTAGAHTYFVIMHSTSGTLTASAATDRRSFIIAEDITATPAPTDSAPSSTLGYTQVVAGQTTVGSTITDLTGLSVTVTVPAGRRLKVTLYAIVSSTVGSDTVRLHLTDGSNNLLGFGEQTTESGYTSPTVQYVFSPAAGTHTFKGRMSRQQGTGTATLLADPAYPAFLLVEDISGVGVGSHIHTELDDSGWITLPLVNGWVSYDTNYGPPRYRKKAGIVYVQGLIKDGTATAGTVVATLPAGFRPSLPRVLFTTTGNSNAINRYDVASSGAIVVENVPSNLWSSLAGITFPADQ